MIRTAYLRVYEPERTFSEEERATWRVTVPPTEQTEERPSGTWLITGGLPHAHVHEGAFARSVDGESYMCPWRTRLRMLAGLLAFRQSVPEEVAEAFVPEREAERAERELAELDVSRPDIRSHIIHANWHVPLRWFAAFDSGERILVEDRNGVRIRYETRLTSALARLTAVTSVLEEAEMDDSVVSALRELQEWLEDFSAEALLELDYGTVAGMINEDDLVDDNCAAQVAACIAALDAGDGNRAGEIFGELTDRWATLRAHEVLN